MSIPKLSEAFIRDRANAKSFQRGEDYYQVGAVISLTLRGDLLQSEVEAREIGTYAVRVKFDRNGIHFADCNCAYNFDGWCKHIVATMLMCVRHPESIQKRPTLEKLLDSLNHLQTQKLVQDLVQEYPHLIEDIDQHVSLITQTVTPQKSIAAKPIRQALDTAPLRRQVRNILHDAVRYWEDGYEDDPIREELLSLVQTAVDFCNHDDAHNALAFLRAITSTCVDNWEDVEQYGADNEEIVEELNDAWCEAILSVELTPKEKTDLQLNLEGWQDEWNADFSLALEALRQGWDYPPLLEVLEGNITNLGAWEAEPPDYADDLALVRLKILEREQRYQEYLYLAEAEGQTQEYLTMLARLGRVEEATKAAKTQMTLMEEAYTLARTLKMQGASQEALDIAQMGLKLPGHSRYELGTWTSDLAEELGNLEVALTSRKTAFAASPSFVDYQTIQDLAGDNWKIVKQDLLEILRTYLGWNKESAKVDIFLHEGLIDDAINTVTDLSSYHAELIHRVMGAAIKENPDWVITNARKRAEKIMNAGKSEYYKFAVDWLEQARNAYLESERKADWSDYKESLIQQHVRKRKLMGLFKQAGMG